MTQPSEDSGRLDAIEKALGHVFKDRGLLRQALVHRSYSHEHSLESNNEPLEFLGDAVLGFLVAERIVRRRSELSEGEMTRLRANLVNTRYLADLGTRLDLGEALMLGRGEELSGGRSKKSLLADGFEALVGAAFLDGGVRTARRLVNGFFGELIDKADPRRAGGRDPKTRLQEYLQGRGLPLPEYRVLQTEGPDHERSFEIGAYVRDKLVAAGRGSSKKRAEQVAAREALTVLRRGKGGSSMRASETP